MYRSSDGIINWQEITLPEDRNVDCCVEWLTEVCFYDQHIRLKFHGDENNTTKYWQANTQDTLNSTPEWRKLSTNEIKEASCTFVPTTTGDWVRKIQKQTREVIFQRNDLETMIVIPQRILLQSE